MDFESFKSENEEKIEKNRKDVSNIVKTLKDKGVKIINCDSVTGRSMVAHISPSSFEESFVTDKSICLVCINVIQKKEISLKSLMPFAGELRCISVFIRLDSTDTWLLLKSNTLVGEFLDQCEKNEFEVNYDDDTEEYSEEDYARLNRLSTIVAKAKGFNLLKNRDQRANFARDILSNYYEEIKDHEYNSIGANAETFYDFGVLPDRVKKLYDEGKSEKDIAKILGHTKARIERALMTDITDVFRKTLDEYEAIFEDG